ncbi:MAG: hypothetical protein FJ086_19020 [Deltaproteobacteria bacterium]|nr:hypothetical protein [Deltaproteobacteria bacterium]
MKRALTVFSALALSLSGCSAVTRGGALSSVPAASDRGMFLSTSGAPGRYTTLGFVQVRGYGVQVAGYQEAGHATLDGPIRGALAAEASRMGGNGVIHIEFLDENPTTDFERAQAAAQSIQNLASGQRGVEAKDRYVTVTGEVIRFEGAVQ